MIYVTKYESIWRCFNEVQHGDMRTCPVCQAAVEPDQHECSRCGFKLVGRTEELVALGVEEVMSEALEEVVWQG
jgi:predicted amidophosphoribosyltransferase